MTHEIFCQSCGMPMQKDEERGTNADGSLNREYCKFCFQKGEFTDPKLTLEKQVEKMAGFADRMSMSPSQARKMAENILPRLKRWRKK